jgi:hypothetical protein
VGTDQSKKYLQLGYIEKSLQTLTLKFKMSNRTEK